MWMELRTNMGRKTHMEETGNMALLCSDVLRSTTNTMRALASLYLRACTPVSVCPICVPCVCVFSACLCLHVLCLGFIIACCVLPAESCPDSRLEEDSSCICWGSCGEQTNNRQHTKMANRKKEVTDRRMERQRDRQTQRNIRRRRNRVSSQRGNEKQSRQESIEKG